MTTTNTTHAEPLAIGERVEVISRWNTTARESRIAEIRQSHAGGVIYVLEDGGFLTANELRRVWRAPKPAPAPAPAEEKNNNDRDVNLDATHEAINQCNRGRGLSYKCDGVAGFLRYDFERRELEHHPSAAGKRSAEYRTMREMLGDDFTTTFDPIWPDDIWAEIDRLGLIRYDD